MTRRREEDAKIRPFATLVRVALHEIQASDLPLRHRWVLVALATWANPDGTNIFPSVELVLQVTGMGKNMLKRTLRELESAGWIVRSKRPPTDKGRTTSTLYEIHLNGRPIVTETRAR